MHFIEKVFNNILCVFDFKDNLDFIKDETLFELNDKNYEEPIDLETWHNTLFDYLEEQKETSMKIVLSIIYHIGKAIEKYDATVKFIFTIKNAQYT